MGQLRILGPKGDEAITWDIEVKEQVDAARETFAERLLSGYLAFDVSERPGTILKEFDPNTAKIILAPPIGGG